MSEHYDFIIAGAGAAGLSLACKLTEGALSNARILLIDQDLKRSNDRTWCFWSEGATSLDHLVYKEWSRLFFLNEQGKSGGDLGGLTYKMIRGLDFYEDAWSKLRSCPNVDFRNERVLHYQQGDGCATVTTEQSSYTGAYIFNSCIMPKPDPGAHFLLQHFAGWWIQTEAPVFKPDQGYLMDFRAPQQDSTRFFYLLPIDEHRALVEFTVFSPERLNPAAYQAALKEYVEQHLGISHYTITEHEKGAIPMTDQVMPNQMYPNVINIGTAAGAVKPTTGYAFTTIQKQVAQISAQLQAGLPPQSSLQTPARFRFYDQLLLNILETRGGLGKGIFSSLFRHTPIDTIFRFLGEQTTVWQEAKIFMKLPVLTFLKAVWRVFGPGHFLKKSHKIMGAVRKKPRSWSIPVQDKLQLP
ncbi:MAG: lycopene cyclase family protein [Phaeodactylibacter sp.]|uniref:lycopene cyclase family protein n=1 Tax=Phaeodactylibacter sp. TaxID=1940289 RepID=UPI0032EF5005